MSYVSFKLPKERSIFSLSIALARIRQSYAMMSPVSKELSMFVVIKGALNPYFYNRTINGKNFALETFWSHFLTFFYKKVVRILYL